MKILMVNVLKTAEIRIAFKDIYIIFTIIMGDNF